MRLRFLSICLCLTLLLGLGVQAMAAEDAPDTAPAWEDAGEAPPERSEPYPGADEAVWDEPAAEDPEDAGEDPEPGEDTQDLEELEDPDLLVQEGMGMNQQLEAAGTDTYSMFTNRSLAACEAIRPGIDVSEWNGDINWKAVRDSGVEFAIIRAGGRGYAKEGKLYLDSNFQKNIQGAKAAGLKVGVYIFSQAITAAEAEAEAKFLIKTIQGYSVDLPLVMDYEYAGTGQGGRLYTARLSAAAATSVCNAFEAEAARNGYESMVYCNLNMLENHLIASRLGRVWLAHYTQKTSYTGSYEYWQCTSAGIVSGISGRVDLDFWYDPRGVTDAPPFLDIPAGSWYTGDVKKAYDLGVVMGTGPWTFQPGANVTRAQVVTMLYRMEGSPAITEKSSFRDVTSGYYVDPVHWAWSNGVVMGVGDNIFAPDSNMTRQDLVVVLYRMAGEPEAFGTLGDFSDQSRISGYARDAMVWAVNLGLIQGYGDKTLQPMTSITRAETCALLMRYHQLVES